MEAIVKKYQQKFKKVRDEMNRWDELQSHLISQFRNASSIIERLQVVLIHIISHIFQLVSFIFSNMVLLFVSTFSGVVGCDQVLQDPNNYGALNRVDGIVNAVLRKQMESLELILLSMKRTV